MSHFKAEMHQIRFRLGLCPQTPLGNLQRSSRHLSWIQRSLLLMEKKEKGKKEYEKKRQGRGKDGEER